MTTSGFGAFFHPPTIIYDEGEREQTPLTFVKGRQKPMSDENIIENPVRRKISCDFTSDDGFHVFVTEDGFVGIDTALERSAFEFLNVFFGTLNTKFQKAHYVSPEDITLFYWDESSDFIDINLPHTNSLRNLFHLKRDREETFPDWERWPKQEIGKMFIENMLDFTYRLYRNEEFKTNLELIGESSQMMLDLRLSGSLLSSWLIIESILVKIAHEMVESKSIKLTKSKWSPGYLINEFLLQEKISQDNFDCLKKFKDLRNDIVHRKKRDIVFEPAWNCLNVAIYMMYNQLNKDNPFKDVLYKKVYSDAS